MKTRPICSIPVVVADEANCTSDVSLRNFESFGTMSMLVKTTPEKPL